MDLLKLYIVFMVGLCLSKGMLHLKKTVEPKYVYENNDTCVYFACTEELQAIQCDRKQVLLVFDNISCDSVNLNFLKKLKGLDEFWFVGSGAYQRTLMLKSVYITFSQTEGEHLSITKLHINSFMKNQNDDLQSLLKSAAKLTEVDFSNSRFITHIMDLSKIIQIIGSFDIRVLSLKMCTHSNTDLAFFYDLNITEVFWPLRKSDLQYLDLSYNGLLNFNGSLLAVLPKLKYLNLAGNFLQQYSELIMLRQLLIYHRNLEEIIADYLPIKQDITEELILNETSHSSKKMIDGTSLVIKKSLANMDNTVRICFQYYNTTINKVINNKSLFCKVVKCLIKGSESGIKYIPCEQIPSAAEILNMIDSNCNENIKIPLAPNLRSLTITNWYSKHFLDINKPICFAPNKLEQLTLKDSTCLFGSLKVKGFTKLRGLTLVNVVGVSFDLEKSLFDLPALEQLSINHCQVNTIKTDLVDIMPNLKVILLPQNNISHLSNYVFKNYSSLENISLERNFLSKLDLDLTDSKSLNLINLAHNTIQYFTKRTISSIIYNFKKFNKSLTVDISNNQLSCTCSQDALSTIEFITYSKTYGTTFIYNDNLLCSSEVGNHILKNISFTDYQERCYPSKLKLIISTTLINFAVMVTFLLIGLSFKFRYRLYTRILRFHWKFKNNNQVDSHFIYDAFISYCSEDRFWVHGILMKELEDKYGFKLCIHYRDFLAGPIVDEIVDKITKSQCIVVVLSHNSIRSRWVEYELHLAHNLHVQRGKRLIILKLGNIEMSLVTSTLVKELLRSLVYIEFPDTPENSLFERRENRKQQAKTELFWTKLINILYNKSSMTGICCYKKTNYSVIDDSTMTG